MTLQEALKEGGLYLKDREIPDAELDAWYLLEYCTHISRAAYFLKKTDEMADGDYARYQMLLLERGKHTPLQHITGEQEFMGLSFRVNQDVLIPRQDTELLVEETLKVLKPGMKVLDLCTGSGCIAISLDRLADQAAVYASDISAEALTVARENNTRLAAGVKFIESDLFEKINAVFDVIVSNPPYIPTGTIDQLMAEVRLHDPWGALDGKADGLHFYRRIIAQSDLHLRRGGWLLFEIGSDQGEAVSQMMREKEFTDIVIKKDLSGLDRVVLGRRM